MTKVDEAKFYTTDITRRKYSFIKYPSLQLCTPVSESEDTRDSYESVGVLSMVEFFRAWKRFAVI